MNNEIGRKITSLTLMAIMVAGGMTFAVPGMLPAAHAANANLFVSAENSQFDNYMSGPQVIEVVVIDSDINDTDEAKGEPDVTVNGKILRMVQAVDGNWYGYFADRDQAQIADSVVSITGNGTGIDFGDFCSASTAGTSVLGDANGFSDTVGVAVPAEEVGATGTSTGGEITQACDYANVDTNSTNNVVREAKTVNTNSNVDPGQIGLEAADSGATDFEGDLSGLWPFIQLYEFNPTGNVVVQYNKGGGVQSTTLTFDTVEGYADISLDRSVYPRGAQVHVTVTDLWLNIDPTDEDSWTFGANPDNATTIYQAFDENGDIDSDASDSGNVTPVLDSLMCEDNCILLFTPDEQGTDVVTIQDNGDSVIESADADPDNARTRGIDDGDRPITITEQGPNSGVFGSYDESDTSALIVTDDAERGKSATVDYNESPITVLVGFDFASIDIQPVDDEWSSGEEIPVIIVDGDANKNSRADEDLDNNDPTVSLIPTLSTGDPFTLGEAGNSTYAYQAADEYTIITEVAAGTSVYTIQTTGLTGATNSTTGEALTVQPFSQRGIFADATVDAGSRSLFIDLATTAKELKASLGDTSNGATDKLYGANLLNIDLRSLNSTNSWTVLLLNSSNTILDATDKNLGSAGAVTAIPLVNGSDALALTLMNGTTAINEGTYDEVISAIFDMDDDDNIGLAITSTRSTGGPFTLEADEAITVDFLSFGYSDDGVQSSERVANQIIRIEAEESGDNTSSFEGSLEYVMINQLNIQDVDTFSGIAPIADDPSFIVIEDLTDEDSPRVSYNDLGADGVVTPVSDQEEAPSHSGVVSLNQDSYKIADTVSSYFRRLRS